MSVYNHRPMVPNNQTRLLELLDAVKGEYDQLSQEVQHAKNQRDEYEHKGKIITIWIYGAFFLNIYVVNNQIQEMNIFQQTLVDLERTQQSLKKQLRVSLK
jgi:glucose repression regulatory protein TUP1